MSKSNLNPKQAALRLIKTLPETVTWDDVVYAVAIRWKIESDLSANDAHRLKTADDIINHFGIKH